MSANEFVDLVCPEGCGYSIRVLPGVVAHNLAFHLKLCRGKRG